MLKAPPKPVTENTALSPVHGLAQPDRNPLSLREAQPLSAVRK